MLRSVLGVTYIVAESSIKTTRNVLHPRRTPVTDHAGDWGLRYETIAFPSLDGTILQNDQEERTITSRRIPEFTTREEEAAWFDSHDMADYQGEFQTVRARCARKLSEGINIKPMK